MRRRCFAARGATLVTSDKSRGFYLVRPNKPLASGETLTMRWSLTRENDGFPNSNADNEIIGNGSYLREGHMPVPGYCEGCELTSNRERFGLPPSPRLPSLGDPAHLDDLWQGINSRSGFHIVIGTDADQTAVSAGVLQRSWEQDGGRYFQLAVFPASERDVLDLEPLYLQHHRLRSGMQRITVRVAEQPGAVAVDPFHLMFDRRREDNVIQLPLK